MVNRPVCAYRMIWVASPDYELPCWRLTKAEVAAQLIITFPRQTASTTNLISKLSDRSLPPLRINFASVLTAMLHLVQSGLGLVAVPEAVARRRIEQGLLRRVETAIELEDLEFTATYFPSPGLSVIEAVAGMPKIGRIRLEKPGSKSGPRV